MIDLRAYLPVSVLFVTVHQKELDKKRCITVLPRKLKVLVSLTVAWLPGLWKMVIL